MIQRPGRVSLAAALALSLHGCGGSSAPDLPTVLQVGGSYQINPTLLQNACGSVTVQPGAAQVTHTAGATDLRLSHAGQTYSGRVERSGAFTLEPLVVSFAPGSTDTVRVAGRFTASGFDATATVDAAHAGAAPCRYLVGWQAAKQGSTNVIPG